MDANRRKSIRALATAAALVLALGCRKQPLPRPATNAANRVVSLSPNTTEALFAIGAGNRLVGRSRFCDYPPEVLRIPSVGGYVDPSLEAILALAPDLVVGARGPAGPALSEKLQALGIETFFPPTESMTGIDSMIADLASKVGFGERARALVSALRARRAEVSRAVAGERRVRVLLVFGLMPIVVAGPESFPNEMIDLTNGENVVATGGAYPTLTIERLITLKPDVIVNAAMLGTPDARGDGIGRDDPGWRELSAVRAGRVVALRDDAVLRPGPRIGEGLAALARALHPTASVP